MFAKVLFFLVFVVILAVPGLAYVASSDNGSSSSEEHHHHEGNTHDHNKGHSKHEKNNKHHHHHGEGPYGGHADVKIKPDSPFMRVKNLTEEFYNEIFVIASGDNYASPEVSNDVHINARAVILQSQTLRDMLYVYPVFFNVTAAYALKGAKVEEKETMTNLINDLVTQVKTKRLAERFEAIKSTVTDSFVTRGKYFKSGATPQEKAQAYDKWLWDPFVGAAAMNKLFYRAVWKNDKPQYKILRSMVDYAKSSKDEKIEKIYANAVAETVKKVCPAHDSRKAAFVFYQNLMDALSEDATLMVVLYQSNEMIPGMILDDKPF